MRKAIKKIFQTFRQEGVIALLKKTFAYLCDNILILPYVRFKVVNLRQNYHLDKLVEFVFTAGFSAIRPLQIPSEILELLRILNEVKPKVVLEIGTAKGGVLFLLSRVAAEDALIMSIDLPGGGFGGGYSILRVPLYKSFALKNQKIHLIRADSHHPQTLEIIRTVLSNRKIDFLFIDGDHTYEGVKRDFEMYSPLVKESGIIGLHDICVHPPETSCEVSRFWNEIKKRYKYMEIVENWHQNWAGIGLLCPQPQRGAGF